LRFLAIRFGDGINAERASQLETGLPITAPPVARS
jgi:hypothetical protein